jgi:hypothetical protein
MRRAWVRVAIGLALAIAAIVALAPATIVDAVLAAQTGGAWHLADARGQWWRGRGVLCSSDGRARLPLAWRIALLPLARGALAIDVDPGDGANAARAMPSNIGLQRETLSLRDLQLQLPAAFATELAPRLVALGRAGMLDVGGTIELRARSFELSPAGGHGNLDARWDRARLVVAGTTVDLGQVTLAVAAQQGRLQGTLRNTGGDLAIEGTVRGSIAGMIAGNPGPVATAITLKPLPSTPEALRRSLPMLGAPDASGAVHITLNASR